MNNIRIITVLFVGCLMIALLLAPSAEAQTPGQVVGMSIACSNDKVYTWYDDRVVSIGTSESLGAYHPYEQHFTYTLPPGKTPLDIIEMGIAGNDHVYAWYRDGTVSSGTSSDLDHYRAPYSYSLAPGKKAADVVGIDIACSNDHVYVWHKDGTATSGTSSDLDKYRPPYDYTLAPESTPFDVVGIGIAGNDHVYAWYSNRTVSSGTSSDIDQYRPAYSYNLALPPPCDIAADVPVINQPDRSIFAVGSRGPSCTAPADMVVRLRAIDPDAKRKTLVEKRGTGTNFEVIPRFSCTGNGALIVFTEVESQGRKVKSREIGAPFCF